MLLEIRNGLVNGPLASPLVPRPLRKVVLQSLGYNVHPTACIAARCWIGSRRVTFDAGSFANVGCFFDGNDDIVIGPGVQLGMHTMIITATHEISTDKARRAGPDRPRPVRVGEGAWVGARCTILAGVTVGAGSVIGAGSLVAQDCESDALYVGSPARHRRDLSR